MWGVHPGTLSLSRNFSVSDATHHEELYLLDVDSSQWVVPTLAVVALLLIVILASAEAALSTISRSRIRAMIENNRAGAEATLYLLDNFQRLRNAFGVLKLGVVAFVTVVGFLSAQAYGISPWVAVPGLLVAAFLLQSLSWALGTRSYEPLAPAVAPMMRGLLVLLSPLLSFRDMLKGRVADSPEIEDEEEKRQEEEQARALASAVGDEDAEIREDNREMIYNIVTLNQTTVREVMIPRPDLVVLNRDNTLREALDLIIGAGHSRIPVYDGNVDNIIGILYAKDLLKHLRQDGAHDQPINGLWREPIFVPSSKMADELLEELQMQRVHIAIVLDEYGGTAGLITIEDILEEIVGEIRDEYDAEDEPFRRIGEYEAEVSGRYDIDDLNGEMDLDLPTDENDTVGGLVLSALGRVAQVGDVVRIEESQVTITVKQMIGRRIAIVRLVVDRPETDTPSSPSQDMTNNNESSLSAPQHGMVSAFKAIAGW